MRVAALQKMSSQEVGIVKEQRAMCRQLSVVHSGLVDAVASWLAGKLGALFLSRAHTVFRETEISKLD
jgi:hypothetical protein